MSQRSTFFEYVAKQDVDIAALVEMAQLRKEFAIQFDKQDYLYLSHFPREQNIWMNAIMYRYSPKVLQRPNIEHHDITITTQKKDEGGKLRQHVKVYEKVPTFTKHLIQKLESQSYDVAKINLATNSGRTAARSQANKALAFSTDAKSKEKTRIPSSFDDKSNASLHLRDALIEKGSKGDDKGFEPLTHVEKRPDVKHEPTDRKPLEFDADDLKYINYFKQANATGKKFSLAKALQLRYSDKLISDPQSGTINYPGSEPGEFFDIKFSTGMAEKVPVNAQRLKRKLEDLNDRGIKFIIPGQELRLDSATNWLSKGTLELWRGRKGTHDSHYSVTGVKEMKSINSWIEKQNAWLDDPENNEEPMVRGLPMGFLKNTLDSFKYEVPWHKIIEQEAEIAAKRALNLMISRLGSLRNVQSQVDFDTVKSDVMIYLAKEDTVSNPSYKDQAWRIQKGMYFATISIKEEVRRKRGVGKGGDDPSKEFPNHPDPSSVPSKKGEEEPEVIPSKASMYQDDPQAVWAAIDLLQNTPEGQKIGDDQVNWNSIAQEFINRVLNWSKINGNQQPSNAQRMVIAKDLLRPLVPTGV